MQCYFYEYPRVFRREDPPPLVFEEAGGGEQWGDFLGAPDPDEGWRKEGRAHWVQDVWTRFPRADFEIMASTFMTPTGQNVFYDYVLYRSLGSGSYYIERRKYLYTPAAPLGHEPIDTILLRIEDYSDFHGLLTDDAAAHFTKNLKEGLEIEPVTEAEKRAMIPDELHEMVDELMYRFEEGE